MKSPMFDQAAPPVLAFFNKPTGFQPGPMAFQSQCLSVADANAVPREISLISPENPELSHVFYGDFNLTKLGSCFYGTQVFRFIDTWNWPSHRCGVDQQKRETKAPAKNKALGFTQEKHMHVWTIEVENLK